MFVSKRPDGFVIASNVFGNANKGVSQALGLDVLNTPDGHAHVGLDSAQGLQERFTTVPALVALNVGQDVDRGATDGAVAVACGLDAVPVQAVNNAALLAGFGLDSVLSLNDAVCPFLPGGYGLPIRKI